MIVIHVLRSISLVVARSGAERTVDRDLLVVGSQAVTVGIRVGIQAALQHLVGAGFNTRHQMGRRESHLLHFSKVVLGVAVESEATDGDQRKFFVGPDLADNRGFVNSRAIFTSQTSYLGQIKWIESVFLCFLEGHDLDEQSVGGEVAFSDGVVQVAGSVIWVRASESIGLSACQVFDSLVGLVMTQLRMQVTLGKSLHILCNGICSSEQRLPC